MITLILAKDLTDSVVHSNQKIASFCSPTKNLAAFQQAVILKTHSAPRAKFAIGFSRVPETRGVP